ncbi:MAG: division/cell wall cluster transcriptional repressor MraZ [Erysipelotrichales bacterium]|nr:division/cell wall cluster transcriptional repressor MraZ [Erysipelotrichales bacterium]
MFFGSYQHTLDAKGRMTIPSKMKDQVGSVLFIMKGFDGCISVYKEEDFQNKMNELRKLPFNELDSRDYMRAELSSVVDLEVDDAGRILLPKRVLQSYNIGKQIMIVGMLDHFEIWDLDAWTNYINEKNKLYEEKANKLPKVN